MRTVFVLGFVIAGLGVEGAALGVLIAEGSTALHARIAAMRQLRHLEAGEEAVNQDIVFSSREIIHDLLFALVAMSMLAVLQNVDVITVAREGQGMSGSYAAISVASKAIVFAA
ncbi:MAG: hypothetical protein NT160_01885, partial [Actinobacteria bacterium]|nr:hypothetical protein [Actinomycetota bacterium]